MQNCKNHNDKQFGHNVKKAPKGVSWKDSAAKFPSIRLSKLRKRQPVTTVFYHTLGLSLISKIVPYSKGKKKKERQTDITFCLWLQQTNSRESMAGAVVRALASPNMAQVRFPDPPSYEDWVCWLSTLLSGTPDFPSYQKSTFDLICYISVWFAVYPTSKGTALG